MTDAEALQALKNGQIDAMFNVIGSPAKMFEQGISTDDKLHLLNIEDPRLSKSYDDTIIPHRTYPWQSEDVKTKSVKAVLISYNYRQGNCTNVGTVARIIYENIDWLKEHGHNRWNDVNFNTTLKGWEQYDCARNAISNIKPSSKKPSSGQLTRQSILESFGRAMDSLKENK